METDAAVLALLRTAAGHLVDAGYDVVETELPDLIGTWKLWCDLIMTELSVLQEAQMREFGSADFRQTLDGFLEDGDDPRQARLHRSPQLSVVAKGSSGHDRLKAPPTLPVNLYNQKRHCAVRRMCAV